MTVVGQHLSWLLLLVDAFAVARLARLVTVDTLLHRPRQVLLTRWPVRPGRWSELVTCPWCCGLWLAGGVLALTLLVPHLWLPVAVVLAFSEVAGIIAERT